MPDIGCAKTFNPARSYSVNCLVWNDGNRTSDRQNSGDTTGLEAQPASVVGAVQTDG